uniref:Phosphotransferase n=1 Tax=Syphacia muris TaxID=451379 RepID=A0A158R5I8_9BILA
MVLCKLFADGGGDVGRFQEVKEVCDKFVITNDQLGIVMNKLLKSLELGLRSETEESASVKMLPSYVRSVPNGKETGNYLALDLGGTNFRVLSVHLDGNNAEMCGQIFRLPSSVMTGSGTKLFDHIAECMAKFLKENNLIRSETLPIGFTFSFPCRQEGLTRAILTKWTKGFCASGVENRDVVTLLHEACLRRGDIDVDVVAVLNDTVGTLMACAFKENTCQIGVIVGTGTNACYMEKLDKCEKLKGFLGDEYPSNEMIINTEWGGFGDNGELDFLRTEFDHEVDRNSINPRKQLFEKMISGMYMGEIVRVVLVHLIKRGLLLENAPDAFSKPHCFPTKYVSEIESDLLENEGIFPKTTQILDDLGIEEFSVLDCIGIAYVCTIVSTRAAHLCAAGIATLLQRMNKPFVTIGVDGSVYRFHPKFPELLNTKIGELVSSNLKYKLMLSEDGSGRGAALVAAVATRLKNEENNLHQHAENPL